MRKVGRKKGKYSQAVRLLKLLEHLQGRRFGSSFADIAKTFRISERQARRDVDSLREAGYAIELADKPEGTAVCLSQEKTAPLRLNLSERYTLLAVRSVFDVLKGTQFFEDVCGIYDKIAASLPASEQQEIADYGDRFTYVPDGGLKSYGGKSDVIDELLTGVLRRVRVRYRYRAANKALREGELEPYAMALYKQGLYVLGRPVGPANLLEGIPAQAQAELPLKGKGAAKKKQPEAYLYAVERFVSVEHIRGAKFEAPKGFDPRKHFEGAFGVFVGAERFPVAIEFSKDAAPFVEARTWHRSQKIAKLSSGRIRLDLEVSDLTQLAAWIMGWGPAAVVLNPKKLRDLVASQHLEAAAAYEA